MNTFKLVLPLLAAFTISGCSDDARVASPAVSYTASGEKLLMDNLSDMAAFFSHLFYIEDNILYLIDMLGYSNEVQLTEFDIFPSSYKYHAPVAVYKTGSDSTEAAIDGVYLYGNECTISPQCNTDVSLSEDALTKMQSVCIRPRAELKFPLEDVYTPGTKLVLLDESMENPLDMEIYVRSVTWNFDSHDYVIEGDGEFI